MTRILTKHSGRFRLVLAAFFAVFLSAFAQAENSSVYKGSAWQFLDQKQVMIQAAAITQTAYPDSDRATVDEKIEYVFEADGTGGEQDESYTKILTEKGKEDARTIVLGFMLPYSTVDVPVLEIIKASGEVQKVDVAANSQESIDDSQMDENIYDPNSRLLKVSVPNLEIGDVLHAVIRQTTDRPIMPGQSSDENLFEGEQYIRHLVYEVRAPKDRPIIRKVLRSELPGKVAYSEHRAPDGSTVMHWEVSDVPRAFEEPSQSSDYEVLQRLFVSTTASWQDISRWYWDLSQTHLQADSPELKAEVAKLTAGEKDQESKIQTLFYYVSREIRYMGLTPEKDRPGYEPHDVRLTFEKKYGVCRDKAALLVSMLRIAGIEAYPVLISVDAKKDPAVPVPYFDHAIVAVAKKSGGYELMDPTDEHARQLLPYYDNDRSFLVCRPTGETLLTSPVAPPEENMMKISTTATLSASGSLRATTVMDFAGANDDAYRNAFAGMKPDEQLRFFETRLKKVQPGARLVSLKLKPENMLDMSQPVGAELEYTIDGLVAAGSSVATASIPWMGKSFGLINYIIGDAGLDKRRYPMRTSVACGVDEKLSIQLDKSFTGVGYLPEASSQSDDILGYRMKIEAKGSQLFCGRTFETKGVEFSPSQYQQLKETLRTMDEDGRRFPLLNLAANAGGAEAASLVSTAAPAVEANARILNASKTLQVTGPHSAIYKVSYSKEILTYEGKVREAEIKIDYNPASEKASFLKGVVTAKDGSRQEISASEINIMDADWNASAKRYTGGKILVANLPGVAIGSTIEVAYQIEMHDVNFLAGSEQFQLLDSIERKSFSISAPDGLKVSTSLDGPQGSVKADPVISSQGSSSFGFSAASVPALPSERATPPLWSFCPGVEYYIGDFSADLAKLDSALLSHAANQPKAAEKARALAAAKTTPEEKMISIRDFVASSIRLAGPSFQDLPLAELSDADTTLTDGYGHGADRAILLYSMLDAAGLSPSFELASSLPDLPELKARLAAFPLPGEFNQVLVKVIAQGQDYYLNDSDQYARLGTSGSEGRLAMDPRDGGIFSIQPRPENQSAQNTEARLVIAKDGSARLDISVAYSGAFYNQFNKYFSQLRPEEKRRFFQGLVAKVAQGAKPLGEPQTDFDSYPGILKYSVALDDFAISEGSYLCFKVPYTPVLLKLDADQRALPFLIGQRLVENFHFTVSYPAGYQKIEIAPANFDQKLPNGGGWALLQRKDGQGGSEIDLRLEADPAIIGSQDYGKLLNFEASIEKETARTFLLKSGN